MILTSACSKSSFDAKGYTEGLMVLMTKQDTTPIVKAGLPQSEADALKNEFFGLVEEVILSEFESFDISNNTKEKWILLMSELLAKSKYSVNEAREKSGEDGYLVDVTINPIMYSKIVEDEAFLSELENLTLKAYQKGEINDDTLFDYMIGLMADKTLGKLDQLEYDQPSTITIEYVKDKDGMYTIKDEYSIGAEIGSTLFK
ncbi:MAG: hypothetical protein Q4C49_07070 [Bacillota bacterium]|nr:hypothetical protein [Bacillota bacterium]